MSQAKVDKYKEYKKNRRENIRKEKQQALIRKIAAWAVVAVIILGVGIAAGVSIYNSYRARIAAMPTYSSSSFALADYAGLQEAAEAAEHEQEHEDEEAGAVSEAASAETDTEAETE